MRQRDLTEVISGRRPSNAYLGRALAAQWNTWGKYEREEADAIHPRLRRLARQLRTGRFGVRIPV